MSKSVVLRFAVVALTSLMLSGCLGLGGGDEVMPAMKSLPPEAQVLLATKGMKQETPIFVRIFKEESELEIWKLKDDGHFYHFKTYPICAWSGTLGPKVKTGDKQTPEGFYTVTPGQMNPNSQFHLAFNLGFPNAYDKANGRTGDALMVHGDCRSAGCFAMTDALIEEIYILAREAFQGGQRQFAVNVFPFRMTEANLAKHKASEWYGFWKTLKEGYDSFETTHQPPKVAVCSKQYLLNANFLGQEAVPDANANCPAYKKVPQTPFDPLNRNGSAVIQAKAQPADVPHVATATAQSQPAQAAKAQPAAPAPAPATAAQPRASATSATPPVVAPRTSATSSKPPVVASSAPAAPHVAAARPVPQNPPEAVATASTQPVSAPAEKKPVETHGLHNVVGSGKSDMINTPQAQQTIASEAFTYGQSNTSGTATIR